MSYFDEEENKNIGVNGKNGKKLSDEKVQCAITKIY